MYSEIAYQTGDDNDVYYSPCFGLDSQVDSILLSRRVLGQAVQPVLLDCSLHEGQGVRQQRKSNKIGSSVFLP